MRKFFTLLLGVMFTTFAFGQAPTDAIKKTDTKPVIDGMLDEGIWDVATVNAIDKPFTGETPTLGESGETTWRALWDDDGIYVFITVTDDVYVPHDGHGGDAYKFDKIEIYFDTNYILVDGAGAQTDGNGNGNGHYQFADDINTGLDDGSEQVRDDGVHYAFLADDPNYNVEYFIPFTKLVTGAGSQMDKTQEIGFDVTVSDNDAIDTPDAPVRNRAVWSNDGSVTSENWVNMDEAGRITLEGAEAGIPIDYITIASGGDITMDNQTMQMMVTKLVPDNVTDSTVTWHLMIPEGSMARASISRDGMITPIMNGDVEVYATSPDLYAESNHVTVNISGQNVTRFELSYIKNGDFNITKEGTLNDEPAIVPGDPWTGGSWVADGVLNIQNTNFIPDTVVANPWDWTVGQNVDIPMELMDDPFVLQLKMWISEPDTFDVDLELIGDDYTRFGATSDPHSADGRSQWRFELTTDPTMYTIPIDNFSLMDDRDQKFNLFSGLTHNTVYVDSVTLVRVADLDLIGTAVKPVVNKETFDVFPNPAKDKLHVNLSSENSRIVIYNSVGRIMEETNVTGNHHVFDVSRYASGMYFVKANNTVVKFMKQ